MENTLNKVMELKKEILTLDKSNPLMIKKIKKFSRKKTLLCIYAMIQNVYNPTIILLEQYRTIPIIKYEFNNIRRLILALSFITSFKSGNRSKKLIGALATYLFTPLSQLEIANIFNVADLSMRNTLRAMNMKPIKFRSDKEKIAKRLIKNAIDLKLDFYEPLVIL